MDFRILGPLEVWADGRQIGIAAAKQRAILAILALQANRPVSSERLVQLLWGEEPPETAANALQVHISQLRKALEPRHRSVAPYAVLVTQPAGYVLRLGPDDLDLARFLAMVEDARVAKSQGDWRSAGNLLRRGLDLWRGVPLADLGEDRFVLAERHRLEELRLHALEQRVEAEMMLGNHAEIVSELETLVAEFPAREGLAGQLMLALYRSGRQAEATEVYVRTRNRLVDDFGVEPGHTLKALYTKVLKQDEGLVHPGVAGSDRNGSGSQYDVRPRSTVPRALSSLVGREKEIGRVVAALKAARLVTITGPGGVGKTRLALEAAARAESEFRDGAWFVGLDSVTDGTSVPSVVAQALMVPQPGVAARDDLPATYLARRDALLVLDNCEHVLKACADMAARVLSTAGPLRLLATSREPLGLSGERIIPLGPLRLVSGPGEQSEAAELFSRRCTDLGVLDKAPAELDVVATICEKLEGIPLAIELAAALTPVLSMADIVGRLDDRFRVLKNTTYVPSPRHRALDAAVDWSYQLLPADEAAAFRRLSVCRGGFDLNAAEAVLGEEAGARPALDIVAALIRKSMVVPGDEPSGERRYHMLETLREFAARHLESNGESVGVSDMHADYFLTLSAKAFARIRTSESDLWVRRLDLERGNLSAALDFLAATHDARFLRMVSALGRYWIRGRVRDGYRWTERAMRSLDPRTEPDLDLLEAWGWLTWQSGQLGAAFEAIDLMLEAALRSNNDAMAGRALNMMATFRNDGNLPVDPQLRRRAEEHLRRANEDWPLALLLNDIGFDTSIQGKPQEGLPNIIEGLKLARRAGDRWLVALILDSAAWTYAEMGDVDRAVTSWAEGIMMTVAAADRYPLPSYLEGFARIACIEDDFTRACLLLAAAASVRNGMGATPGQNWAEFTGHDVNRVRAALGEEKFDAAWQRGLDLSPETAVELAVARVLDPDGRAYSNAGDEPR